MRLSSSEDRGFDATAWLPYQTTARPDGVRLFCFPHAGGAASTYLPWRSQLDTVVVCPVQPPGRETRRLETAARGMGELVDAVAESLWSHCRRPYAFFGHSMGALVAYESALAIQRLGGAPPDLLIVSGCAAPQAFRLQRRLHHLPSDELWQEVGRLGGVAPEVLKNPELLELLEPALRADFELCDSYRPSAPLERIESDIHAFVGEADPWVEEASVRAWQRSTLGAFSLEVMPGGHFSLYDASLAFPRRIQQALQTVSEGRAVVRD